MISTRDNIWMEPKRSDFTLCQDGLAERLEGHIERRACGRIRDLHVVCTGQTIILHGRSRTYHAKQLAQEAVFDLTGDHTALANQIVVC
jgi:hypothetical protein